jgi:hypothetical protein
LAYFVQYANILQNAQAMREERLAEMEARVVRSFE